MLVLVSGGVKEGGGPESGLEVVSSLAPPLSVRRRRAAVRGGVLPTA